MHKFCACLIRALLLMSFLVATNVVTSRPPERRPTGTPRARANNQLDRLRTLNFPGQHSVIRLLNTFYSLKGQLTTDENNRKICNIYIILFPVWLDFIIWPGIKLLNYLFIYLFIQFFIYLFIYLIPIQSGNRILCM